ncbi:MAG: MBL fold metallo-hydrolase [Planctomycetota bacterium]|nr:MAG: MBL fold metallo-hydrolase [Planctomycetota bacterium]
MSDTDVERDGDPGAEPVMALRVLASGSGGNCSALILREGRRRRVCLIDLGLSPRMTEGLLGSMGLGLSDVEHVLLTHFDHDHFRPIWARRLPGSARCWVHAAHEPAARAAGISAGALGTIDDRPVGVGPAAVRAVRVAHDEAGVAAFRIEHAGSSVGYVTDVGRPTEALAGHVRGVDLLAVESNYCPRLQAASARPEFLKRRIMGGAGHLSNQQSAELVRRASPRADVVLLHLSRQCNRPDLALAEHSANGRRVTVSSQHRPTPWVPVAPGRAGRDGEALSSPPPVGARAAPGLF